MADEVVMGSASSNYLDEEAAPPSEATVRLLEAVRARCGAADARALLEAGADASYQEHATGESVLMAASAVGSLDVVQLLLENGAPWNAIDRRGRCAGQYAIEAGHQLVIDALVTAGVAAELVFGAVTAADAAVSAPRNFDYLQGSAEYQGDKNLVQSATADAVMMEWERPLMVAHAAAMCGPGKGGRVLNVGFGMGIIDECLQEYSPSLHTIVEAHPDVLKEMRRRGWYDKPNVRVVEGRWQDVNLASLGPFDAAFFDTFGEHLDDLREFHRQLPSMLRPGSVYSFFNGMCPGNIFFQGVACEVVRLELLTLGLECTFHSLEVDAGNDETWKGIAKRYFHASEYFLPLAVFDPVRVAAQPRRAERKRGGEADAVSPEHRVKR